jgi:hypothetical protein
VNYVARERASGVYQVTQLMPPGNSFVLGKQALGLLHGGQ